MATEWESAQYDQVYATGGSDKIYDLPYRHSGYYPLFKAVARALAACGARTAFEVGCGTGGFAHLWLDRGSSTSYSGFDFSPIAVARAKSRTGRPDLFFVGDARLAATYERPYDAIICTEVLEHIEADLEVITNWRASTHCICSVPNFAAENHVRVFSSKDEVIKRYSPLIDISEVVEIKKPYLFDLSWGSYARELRWNRYRPDRLKKILGFESFDQGGGWYLFSGKRRG